MSEWRMQVAPVGNYQIHYVDEGEGFPILLIHGLAGDHTAWYPQIEAWRSRHRVLATDTRGAGRSTQVDEPVTIRELAMDLLAVLDHAGVETCHLIGRSMGGFLAQHIAFAAPERIRSLVMLASAAKVDPLAARLLTNMRDALEWTGSWAAHAAHSVPNFVSQRFFIENPDRIQAIETLIGGEQRMQACYVRQSHACLAHDTLDRLHEIACPVLLMAGGQDRLCGANALRSMAERLPDCDSEVFEDSSHFFLMEEPERFMARIDGWLEAHTPTA